MSIFPNVCITIELIKSKATRKNVETMIFLSFCMKEDRVNVDKLNSLVPPKLCFTEVRSFGGQIQFHEIF